MSKALEHLYKIKSLKDLPRLKQESFLKSLGLDDLSLQIAEQTGYLDLSKPSHGFSFQQSQTLQFQNKIYGEVVFYSHKNFSKVKRAFLEKLSLSLSAALFFIEENQKASLIESQWQRIFNSFPQSFCITNEALQIILCNQAFRQLFGKTKEELLFQNLFKLFPVPVKIPKTFKKKPSSFIAKGENEKTHWKIACQKLYLKKESGPCYLFLIKDVSAEMEIEAKISSQSKNQEIGWMKGSLAHELNNPITGVKLLISIIENELSDSDPLLQEHLKEMQKATSACQSVIQNLLSASKTPSQI